MTARFFTWLLAGISLPLIGAGLFAPARITSFTTTSTCSTVACTAPTYLSYTIVVEHDKRLTNFEATVACSDGSTVSSGKTPGGVYTDTKTSYVFSNACPHSVSGSAEDTITLAHKGVVVHEDSVTTVAGGADLAIASASLANDGFCVSPCSDMVANLAVASVINGPYKLMLDAADPRADGTETDCDDLDFETPLGSDADGVFTAVALPDFTATQDINLCVEDADGSGATHVEIVPLTVSVDQQEIAGRFSASPTLCVAGSCNIDVIFNLDTEASTCPWTTTGYNLGFTNCGTGCTRSAEFTAGLTGFMQAIKVFDDACVCPVSAIGNKTISGGLSNCGLAGSTVITPANYTVNSPTQEAACDDNQDNDGDGDTDFPADAGCSSASSNTEDPACNNGEDDDLDAFADYGPDPGCASAADPDEHGSTLPCDDAIDNDQDGKTDVNDPSCVSPISHTETMQCDDNLDNDADGDVDHAETGRCGTAPQPDCDANCSDGSDNTESPAPAAAICDNNNDDDGDGKTDFDGMGVPANADPGCGSAAGTTEKPACNDVIDNDGDGKVDLADGGCGNQASGTTELGGNACNDGTNNADGDSLVDYPADPGCCDDLGTSEAPACDDKVDNDTDGLVDTADSGCTGTRPGCDSDEFSTPATPTLTFTIEPKDASGNPLVTCPSPCTLARLDFVFSGTFFDAPGIQRTNPLWTDVQFNTGWDGQYKAGQVPLCHDTDGNEIDCGRYTIVPTTPHVYTTTQPSQQFRIRSEISQGGTIGVIVKEATITVTSGGTPPVGDLEADKSLIQWDLVENFTTASTQSVQLRTANGVAVAYATTETPTPTATWDTLTTANETGNTGTGAGVAVSYTVGQVLPNATCTAAGMEGATPRACCRGAGIGTCSGTYSTIKHYQNQASGASSDVKDVELRAVVSSAVSPTNTAPNVILNSTYDMLAPATTIQIVPNVADDGNPAGQLLYTWSVVSGTGCSFSATDVKSPFVTRTTNGSCTVRVVVSDTALSTTRDTIVTRSDPAVAAEQRCTDLGAGCVCSEPLNWVGPIPTATRSFNPGDSAAKECNGEANDQKAVTMPADWQTAMPSFVRAGDAGVPLPSGQNIYVYKTKLDGAQHLEMDEITNLSNETLCVRAYRRYDAGTTMTSSSTWLKNLQIGGTPSFYANIEHNWDGLGAFVAVSHSAFGLSGTQYDTDFQAQCNSGWCRLEICADQTGSTLTYRYQIKHFASGATHNFTHGPGTGGTSQSFQAVLADMFVQNPAASNLLGKYQYLSHVLQARVPHNTSFYIGPACEVETPGGCAGAPSNQAPVVSLPTSHSITSPATTVQMNPTVTDDGLPAPTLTYLWSIVSGTGCTFSATNIRNPVVTRTTNGSCTARIVVSDSALSTQRDTTITRGDATGTAGAERRCGELGAECVCSEPLNTNSRNGGNTTGWEWGSPGFAYDMDDSPDTTECSNKTGAEMYCSATPGMRPVPASGQPLPPGHSLSWVLQHRGQSTCHISNPHFFLDRATGTTYCIRHYRRWDPASEIPGGPLPGGGEPQQKITTIGGCADSPGGCGAAGGVKVQISVAATGDGTMSGGSDTIWSGIPANFDSYGKFPTHCTNNYCRFEACLDFGTNGNFESRRRMVVVPPGNPALSSPIVKMIGSNVNRPSHWIIQTFNNGLMWFGQFTPGLWDYGSHFLVVRRPVEDKNFWIGPACEVEGGC